MGTGIDPQKPILDHVVFNVRFEMDRAASLFETVGFQLTDRGYHTLGSINHLMMLTTDYLELIGLPSPDSKPTRADIAAAPYGLNGLVFKSADVHETYEHLKSIGMAGDPPKSFSRPVQLDDGEVDASFRTVTVRSDVFSAGRVYFCEHLTPEYVWRPEWQTHANSASALRGFVLGARTLCARPSVSQRYWALNWLRVTTLSPSTSMAPSFSFSRRRSLSLDLEVLPRFPLMEHWHFARYRLRLTVGTSIVSLLVVCR